jgi:hypothetical protein
MDDTMWNTIRIILVVLREQNPDLLRELFSGSQAPLAEWQPTE